MKTEKTIKNKSGIIDSLISNLHNYNEIIFALIYGSFMKEERYNDIDIGLYIQGQQDSYLQYELNLETDMIISGLYPREVDIRVLNKAPLYFKYNIIKEGTLLFTRDDNVFSDFKELVIRDYLDFQPYYKEFLKEAMNFEI